MDRFDESQTQRDAEPELSEQAEPLAAVNVPHEPARVSARGFSVRAVVALMVVAAMVGGIIGGATVASLAAGGNRTLAQVMRTAAAGASGETSSGAIPGGPVTDFEQNTISVARQALPGIVQVRVQGKPQRVQADDDDPLHGFPFPVPRLPDRRGAPEVQPRGIGSGFVIDTEGHIVSNHHVVDGAASIKVVFPNGNEYPAKVLGGDRLTDLAVLKIDAPASELHPLPLGDSDAIQVGQKAIAIGSPFGSEDDLGLDKSPTVTLGIVSAKDRTLPVRNRRSGVTELRIERLIQTDAPINPGNSGGPLLNSAGEVIGVNTAIVPQAQGIGFAVPVNTVRRVVPTLKEGRSVERPVMGITFQGIDGIKRRLGENLSRLGLSRDQGALITSVNDGSPAAAAGLRGGSTELSINGQPFVVGGDIIVAIDGTPVRGDDLQERILAYRPGDTITVTYVRAGAEQTARVTLGKR